MGKESHDTKASELAARLHGILRLLRRRLREQVGQQELTPSQVAVILRLEKDGPATVSSLARAEGMKPQSMSAIITVLQDEGWVKGEADPGDGRKTLMSLTKSSKRQLQSRRAAKQDWLTAGIAKKLSEAEQEQLMAACELLSRITED